MEYDPSYKAGDVFQIVKGRAEFRGCLVIVEQAEDIRPWGIVAYVLTPASSGPEPGRYYIRLAWDEIEHVGLAPLLPAVFGSG